MNCRRVRELFGPWGRLLPVNDFGAEAIKYLVGFIQSEMRYYRHAAEWHHSAQLGYEKAIREALDVASGKYTTNRPTEAAMVEILKNALGEG